MINEKQKRFLRGRSHQLKPVVMIGQSGLTEAVLNELEIALKHHELIKVKIDTGDREQRRQIIDKIVTDTQAVTILTIGNKAVFFKSNPRNRHPISLPG